MTIPIERFNSVIQTRAFLVSLMDPEKTPSIPEELRWQARSLLKHYPTRYDMEQAAEKVPAVFSTRFFEPTSAAEQPSSPGN